MKLSRSGVAVASLAAASALVLGACSSNADKGAAGSSAAASKVADITCAGKQSLKASGSTAQANAMKIFSTSFAKTCPGFELAYGGGGSGQGISDFNQNLTDFGGSDSPLKDEEIPASAKRCGSEAWHLPLVFGPIAVAYNVDGVTDLALSAPTLAKIFSGQITNWNAPEIRAENEGKTLPDLPISVIYRADQSGTTDNFQKYLTAAGGWSKGAGKTFNGGIGEGKQGNPGVGSAVKPTPGSIAYVEWAFAKSNDVSMAKIITDQDKTGVALTAESGGKTIESATLKDGDASHNMVIDTNSFYKPTTAGAYPIMLATYSVVCSKYADTATGQGVKTFLNVAANPQNQDTDLENAGYIPLPQDFQTKLQASISAIQ